MSSARLMSEGRVLLQRIDQGTFVQQWSNHVAAGHPAVVAVPDLFQEGPRSRDGIAELAGEALLSVTCADASGIMRGRNEARTVRMSLAALLKTLDSAPHDYCIAGVSVKDYPRLAGALRLPDPLAGKIGKRLLATNLWVGGGYKGVLHYDPAENLNVQIGGRKRFRLFPPHFPDIQPRPLRSFSGHMATVGSVDELPEHAQVRAQGECVEVELNAGEMLYVPFGWWHEAQPLDSLNINVNYWWMANYGKMLRHPRQLLTGVLLLAYRKFKGRRVA